MTDFLLFRRMLTPVLIVAVFWIGTGLCIITGIVDFFTEQGVLKGLQVLIIGPILLRIICELCILFFRINETLTDIKNIKTAITMDKK